MRLTRIRHLVAITLAAATISAAPSQAQRLGTDVVPTFQSVRLRVDADQVDYSGSVEIQLEVRKPTTTFQLHAQGQTLEQVTLTQKGKAFAVSQAAGERGLLTLTAAQPLAKGPATLAIRFTNAFNTQAASLYRMVKDGAGYTFTQFEAEDARRAFPCWDEPSFKFPYQMTLEVPAAHQALFNTPIERETTKDGWRTVLFKKTPPLPSYLLALSTGPLEFTPVPGMKVPTRIVTVKGQSHLTGFAVEVTPRALEACERYFGTPYPFEKLDLLAVPEYWFGAMENPGAITYSDNILLVDPQSASTAQRRNHIRVTMHELTHMWFGDLVTMAWWDDLWLNESFADWLGDKLTDQMEPKYKHLLVELQDIQDIMESDARPSTEAVRLPAKNGEDAMRAVGVAYNKGKAVLAMFEYWMGAEVFRQGVVDYLAAHEWKNAVAADLWAALGKASGKDVTGIMGGFIEQSGLPLVTVEPLEGGSVRLSQKRLLNHGVQADPRSWQIPMTIEYSDGATVRSTTLVLSGPSQTIKLDAARIAWIMPNGGARGYYRWSVPQDMLLALAKAGPEAMDPAERIAFVGNLTSLLDAGAIRGDVYMKALGELSDDPEPLAASAVLAGLDKVRLAFIPDDLRDPFAVYVRQTLQPMAQRFGMEKRDGEEEAVSLLRPALMAWLGRDGHDASILKLASEIATRYMADPTSVDPATAGVALQLHALGGDRTVFDAYKAALEGAKVPTVRQRYLGALGHFADPALEEAALQYALDGPLRPNELFQVPGGVGSRSDRGADRTFTWYRENYEKLAGRIPPSFRPFFARVGHGCSAERLAMAQTFFTDPARTVEGMDKELGKVADQVNDCVGLREREGPAVSAYLKALMTAN